MANFDPRIGHFPAAVKVLSKGKTQLPQEENCSAQHMSQGAEAFEISDFLVSEEEFNHSCKSEDVGDRFYNFNAGKSGPSVEREYTASFPRNPQRIQGIQSDNSSTVFQTDEPPETMNPKKSSRKRKPERAVKYAFLTRSESDNQEDGYKWRKYGKKYLKNSPNPRNYYRCTDSNCDVKKTVERDAQDNGIVITTYLGKHNHESPTVIYYIGRPEIHQASATMANYQPGTRAFFCTM